MQTPTTFNSSGLLGVMMIPVDQHFGWGPRGPHADAAGFISTHEFASRSFAEFDHFVTNKLDPHVLARLRPPTSCYKY